MKDKVFCEIGCGEGDLLNGLSPCRGVGIDHNQSIVDLASKKYKKLNI